MGHATTDMPEPNGAGPRAGVITGAQLVDLVVDLINSNGRYALFAVVAQLPLTRDRAAIDITDADGRLWRVDVHTDPRTTAT
jgi:hypothetical protein